MTGLAAAASVVAIALLVGCLLLVAALVAVRVVRERAARRRARLRGPTWRQVMVLTTGEDDEAEAAARVLAGVDGPTRSAVVDDMFALVPKVRGKARDRLRDVLRGWGLTEESRALAGSRSVVRRCRGLHRLGVLADPATVEVLRRGLDDRAFAARRTALLGLGNTADPDTVRPALDRAVLEPRLRRDFLAAMDRIGAPAVPVLRAELSRALAEGPEEQRRGYFAAEALGLVGAVSAAPALEGALRIAGDDLRTACLEALGELGLPSSSGPVAGQLGHPSVAVRRAAARALGRIGGDAPLAALAAALDDHDVQVARAAAVSLQQLGSAGSTALRGSDAPVAREALALAALGAAP
jgi:HEAT repeat protein